MHVPVVRLVVKCASMSSSSDTAGMAGRGSAGAGSIPADRLSDAPMTEHRGAGRAQIHRTITQLLAPYTTAGRLMVGQPGAPM